METDYFEIVGIVLFFLGIGIVVVVDIIKGRSANGPKGDADPDFFKVTHRTVHHPGGINPLAQAWSSDPHIIEMMKGTGPINLVDPDYHAPWPHEANPHVAPPVHIDHKYRSDY